MGVTVSHSAGVGVNHMAERCETLKLELSSTGTSANLLLPERQRLGATYLGSGRCHFLVWAPTAERVELQIVSSGDRCVPLERAGLGYHKAVVDNVEPGILYGFRLNGQKERPDPASRYQPGGVHGPSELVDFSTFPWNDGHWSGLKLEDYVLYELHVGTFSVEGTFNAVVPRLDELRLFGITALELMPVAQFPGNRNWGYDGVYPFAVQSSYGGPEGLMRLVDACHQRDMAVVMDVVYNHLGPEGNYLADFGPYFTDAYRMPWGAAVNFDGPQSDNVVRFFVENAFYWIDDFHIDALRLDAIHGIVDRNAQPFLALLTGAVQEFAKRTGRKVYVIGESDLNDSRFLLPQESHGYGLDAQWNDDFHHAVHTLLTGERTGCYQDFGRMEDLVKAFSEGYVYSGQFSEYRQRRHGNCSREIPAHKFIVFAQNHDQIGNRTLGERLTKLVSFEALKLCAGLVVLSPFVPLLFMGEEYGETAPFLYFTSHSDPDLIQAVRTGRKEDFAAFGWQQEPPDPQGESTFAHSNLNHDLAKREPHRNLRDFYQELIRLRRSVPALRVLSKENADIKGFEKEKILLVTRWSSNSQVFMAFNLGDADTPLAAPMPKGRWEKCLDSSDQRWGGRGSTTSEMLVSDGQAELRLQSKSFRVFCRT